MTKDKIERLLASIFLIIFLALPLFVSSRVRANLGRDSVASTATFRTKCATCHGQDGSGSPAGKSMNVPDLRSLVVQELPDAQLSEIISDGKGGMPPFKNSLSEQQIHGLITYVRTMHHPVLFQRGREGTL